MSERERVFRNVIFSLSLFWLRENAAAVYEKEIYREKGRMKGGKNGMF